MYVLCLLDIFRQARGGYAQTNILPTHSPYVHCSARATSPTGSICLSPGGGQIVLCRTCRLEDFANTWHTQCLCVDQLASRACGLTCKIKHVVCVLFPSAEGYGGTWLCPAIQNCTGSKHNKRYDSTGLLSDKQQLIYRYCTQVVEYIQLAGRSPGMQAGVHSTMFKNRQGLGYMGRHGWALLGAQPVLPKPDIAEQTLTHGSICQNHVSAAVGLVSTPIQTCSSSTVGGFSFIVNYIWIAHTITNISYMSLE